MKPKRHELTGTASRRRIVYDNPFAYDSAIDTFEGKRITVTLEPEKQDRTGPQNRYFHAFLPLITDALVNDCGWEDFDNAKTKAYLKEMFLRSEKNNSQYS